MCAPGIDCGSSRGCPVLGVHGDGWSLGLLVTTAQASRDAAASPAPTPVAEPPPASGDAAVAPRRHPQLGLAWSGLLPDVWAVVLAPAAKLIMEQAAAALTGGAGGGGNGGATAATSSSAASALSSEDRAAAELQSRHMESLQAVSARVL